MGFTIEVKLDMFCRVWALYHDFLSNIICWWHWVGWPQHWARRNLEETRSWWSFLRLGAFCWELREQKHCSFLCNIKYPVPFVCIYGGGFQRLLIFRPTNGMKDSKVVAGQNHQAKMHATLSLWSVSHQQATRLGFCWKRCFIIFIPDPKEPSKNGNYAPAEMWDQAIECTSCTISRHVESTSRWESHRSTTPSRHEAHHWNKWHHVQLLSMRHWMYRQDSKWQSQRHPWWFWFPNKFLHHPIVRRPTTRSACRDCWREKRNHLRTPDVRAAQRRAQRWELPKPRALWGRHDGQYALQFAGENGWKWFKYYLLGLCWLVMMLLIIVDLCSKSARI